MEAERHGGREGCRGRLTVLDLPDLQPGHARQVELFVVVGVWVEFVHEKPVHQNVLLLVLVVLPPTPFPRRVAVILVVVLHRVAVLVLAPHGGRARVLLPRVVTPPHVLDGVEQNILDRLQPVVVHSGDDAQRTRPIRRERQRGESEG